MDKSKRGEDTNLDVTRERIGGNIGFRLVKVSFSLAQANFRIRVLCD